MDTKGTPRAQSIPQIVHSLDSLARHSIFQARLKTRDPGYKGAPRPYTRALLWACRRL